MNGIASLSDEDISRIVKSAHEMLDQYNLCDSCLGRQFAFLGRNITNSERGRALKLYLTLVASELIEEGHKTEGIALLKTVATHGNFSGAVATLKKLGINVDPVQACYICEGFMEKIGTFAELITKKLNNWEYRTFLIGSRIPEIVIDREDVLRAKFNIKYGESIKAELNREIGKRITGLEKEVNFESPDILAIINPITQDIEMHINPLFIFGRYRKLKRGISQTRWICWNCEGRGCDECEGKGLR
ncbi:MAG: tRNA pseudouridine(54/55) synthase Pus10, partial [Candidatus Helarchaeota archaeon]